MTRILSSLSGAALLAAMLSAIAALLLVAPTLGRTVGRRPGRDEIGPSRPTTLDLVDVIERITRELRTGRGLRPALVDALALAPSVMPDVATALARHVPIARAVDTHVMCGDERDLLAHALRLGAEHTHVLPDVLDRTAAVVRERRAWRHERTVQAAQARASARVLTVLPLAFAAWGITTSESVRAAYATSAVTVVITVLGLALNVTGWWWMRRVVSLRT